jgi:hypothetical protein
MHTTNRKRLLWIVMWTLLAAGGFGYSYFRAAQKSWSWPVAGLLALVWGALCILAIRRCCRSGDETTKQKK